MKYEIIPARNLVILRVSGTVTYERVVSFAMEVYEDPEYSAEMNGIADFSEADLSVTYEEMRSLVEWMRSRPQRSTGAWAFVTRTPLTHGVTRVFAGLGDNLQATIEYFGTFQEALEWIDRMG